MSRPPDPAVLIVGAGVAGLSCARALADAGRPAVVVERARGVGGRCATRRLGEQPVDFGVAFLHGRDPAFLAALAEVPATALPGWPLAARGAGRPCQPEAFTPGELRLAFAEGVSALPKHLARGLEVRLRARATALAPEEGALRVALDGAGEARAPTVVLATAPEQAAALLATVPGELPAVASARALLDLSRSRACLALLARYPAATPPPPWHVCFPEGSQVLQVAIHDSAKRPGAPALVLVLQGHTAWSRAHLEDPGWPAALLEEAGRWLGPWAARPEHQEAHRWLHARSDRSAELSGPVLLALPGGARLGLCGDRFAPGGGVEAAWRSGRALAARILEEERR